MFLIPQSCEAPTIRVQRSQLIVNRPALGPVYRRVMTPHDAMQPYEVENALRSHTVDQLRDIHRRLRYFSFVTPRPKEAEGDSLQVWWRVNPEQSNVVAASVLAAAVQPGEVTVYPTNVEVRLWNDDDHVYEVTETLVERAVQLEHGFEMSGLADVPREQGLSFITRDRHPDLFDPS